MRVLVVEDSEADYLLNVRHLERGGLRADCRQVSSLDGLHAALSEGGWDAVLSDYLLPGLAFSQVLNLVKSRCPGVPLILVSGKVGEEQAIDLLREGVWDFVLKDRPARLVPALRSALEEARLRVERARMQASLRVSEERVRVLFERMAEGYAHCRVLWEGDAPVDWVYLAVNPAFTSITGIRNAAGHRVTELIPGLRESSPDLFEAYGRVARSGAAEHFESFMPLTGAWYSVDAFSPAPGEFVSTFRDITEQRRAEEALRAASAYSRNLIETSLDPLVTISPEGKITDVNQATERATGYGRQQLIGSDFVDYFTDPEKARAGYREVFSSGQVVDYPLAIRHASGMVTEVLYNASVYRDADGAVLGVFAAARDITERRKQERKLQESESRYRTQFLNMAEGAFVQRADGKLLAANPAALKMLGLTLEEFLERTSHAPGWDVVWEDGTPVPGDQHPSMHALRTGRRVTNEVLGVLNPKTRRRVWMEISAIPEYREGEDTPYQVLVNLHDISERRRNTAILEARGRLEDLAGAASLEELLRATLDEAEILIDSRIGFFHFIDTDQQSLTLQAWSTQTAKDFCRAEGHGLHYPVAQAGVWADALREGRPVIHNDYPALPNRKGLPDGHAQVFRELVVPLFRDGRIVALLGVGNKVHPYDQEDADTLQRLGDLAWDLAEWKQAAEALKRSEEKFARIFQHAPMLISLSRSEDGGLLAVNEAWERAMGYSAEEVIGRGSLEVDWLDAADRTALLASLGEKGQLKGLEIPLRRKDGVLLSCLCSSEMIEFDGKPCILTLSEDITEKKRLETEHRLFEAQLQRAQKLESLGTLAGGVAHEMNNVLGAILGLATVHREREPAGTQLWKNMDTIQRACLRGRGVIQSILGFARRDLVVEQVLDLNGLVRDSLALLDRGILLKIRIETELGEGLPSIKGDPAALGHALAHLIQNGADAMPEGGTLALRTRKVGDAEVMLQVADDGLGMDPDLLGKALDPFFTTKPQGKGTGLGLPIAYGTVKAHHGRLDLASAPGKGTTVTILLPAYGMESAEPASSATRNLRILAVDDDPLLQVSLRAMLEALGHQPTIARGGEEALGILSQGGPFDALILDMNMPGMDGAAVLPKVRARRPGLPVLLSTGSGADAKVESLLRATPGVTLLPKPFDLEEIAARLRDLP